MPINVNFRYRAEEVGHVLSDSGADVFVFHGSLASIVAELAARPAHLVQIDDGEAGLLDGAERRHLAPRARRRRPRRHRALPADLIRHPE